MNNIMDGKLASQAVKMNLKKKIEFENLTPSLTVIQVGDNKASNIYIKNKKNACDEVGIKCNIIKFPETISEELVINEINRLNNDISVNGIIVQLPLPSNFNEGVIINEIDPIKDVDGLTYQNVGNLVLENEALISCTPLGVMELLKQYNVKLEGKNVCIVGRSNLVGKPLIQLFLQKNATVSICHSKSLDIKKYTKMADILVVAAGHPNLITKDMVKEGAVVIDVGINKENNVLCGDVDFKHVSEKASLITPVPGGVGPMTVACLLKNVVKAYLHQNK
ncbi:MAG: bifunctional methylenetetrahydrofolate dehydrogenase/methenyltetrahydrofolate cyclohydrolase [Tenericutes bacterium]|nr:bifunctional methylenetetrahydrofolate dehydrogenase/methenyltetrahydrofolate cyclohydrolase [Mycoplasmatota bacterium]